jgi:hypothetical protein
MQKEKNSIFTSYVTIEKSPGVFSVLKKMFLKYSNGDLNFVCRQTPVHNMKKQPPVFDPKTKAKNHDIYFKGAVRRDVSGSFDRS